MVSKWRLQRSLVQQKDGAEPGVVAEARMVEAVAAGRVSEAVIDEAGEVASIEAKRGHPALRVAAIEAVRQWRFRPATIDGEPAALRKAYKETGKVDFDAVVELSVDGVPTATMVFVWAVRKPRA